ncbi:MAG: hypothetical protein A2787_07690 [Omnitrophica WOR_2 bacterium RIFCSPHIGHO2_01_FULL_48_9]|nr:MAG: hypothetical protein A3D10_05710 [Omnitrophica WOR_2 bacterium RIFCSPHIGHO2_02_FULL_48_11]OGX32574.1 MAG: hypothetical protein A2787_07690 [Omnitrophica WOR_2 bacterium RIFCSPHIGHO2_01_FULL_48_9]
MRCHYFILTVFFCSMGISPALAQSEPIVVADPNADSLPDQGTSGRDNLGQIKADISRLLEENNKLQAQYETLKTQILGIQTDINARKMENQRIEAEARQTQRFIEQEKNQQGISQKKIERLKQEIAGNDGKTASLRKELVGYDDKIRLWKLKISDLELQKNDLNLELKKQETLRQDIQGGETEEIKKLKEQISTLEGEEGQVTTSLVQVKGEHQQFFDQINNLKEENKKLAAQIAEVQGQKEAKMQSNAQLRQEQGEAQSKVRNEYLAKLQQKNDLEARIKQLENQVDSVRRSVELSSTLQEQKRILVDQIMNLDKENRNLRDKVAELRANLATLKQASSTPEAANATK